MFIEAISVVVASPSLPSSCVHLHTKEIVKLSIDRQIHVLYFLYMHTSCTCTYTDIYLYICINSIYEHIVYIGHARNPPDTRLLLPVRQVKTWHWWSKGTTKRVPSIPPKGHERGKVVRIGRVLCGCHHSGIKGDFNATHVTFHVWCMFK